MAQKPLTDAEICRKFEVEVDTSAFHAARRLSDGGRPDSSLCDLPDCDCPHCGESFFLDDYGDYDAGDEIECPKCERTIYILGIETTITANLSTHPETES